MTFICLCRKKNEDRPDGMLDLRGDNARFHPLVILLDMALNGTMDEVKHILPKVRYTALPGSYTYIYVYT